jgi:hypothetical protein
MGTEQNGQGIQVSPDAVIESLMARIQQLTMELVMKDAYIRQLQEKQDAPSPVP